MCTLLYTISTHFAISQSVLQNQFTELRPSVITILNCVDQSKSLTGVRNSYSTQAEKPHFLKSAIQDLKTDTNCLATNEDTKNDKRFVFILVPG